MNKKTPPIKSDQRAALSELVAKNQGLPRSPIQEVRPVAELVTLPEVRKGRKSAKEIGVEYVKIGPKIPATLKQDMDIALVTGRCEGIKTIDEFVGEAIRRMLEA